MAYRERMRDHPLRLLLILLAVVVGVGAYRLATADEGGTYDPEAL